MWLVAWILAALLSPANARSQSAATPSSWSFGGFSSFNVNFHTASFQSLRGVPIGPPVDTALFGNNVGFGFTIGALAELPFSEMLGIQVRLSFATHGASITAREPIRAAALTSSGVQFYDAIFQRTIDGSLSSIGIEPLAVLAPVDGLRELRFFAGLRAGYMLSRSFSQVERILSPNEPDLVFNNNDVLRNPQSGVIPDGLAFNLGATVGAGYDIRVTDEFIVAPELLFTPTFTPVADNLRWHYMTLRGGVSVRYAPKQEPPVMNEPPIRTQPTPTEPITSSSRQDTLDTSSNTSEPDKPQLQHTPPQFSNSEVNPSSTLSASIAAFAVDENGIEQPLVQLKVEQYVAQQMYPLMNYIFFDQGSGEIPEKYRRLTPADTVDYDEQKYYNVNMLKIYYDIMNVIGKRLRTYPKAKITLTGCNNSVGVEVGNIPLSFRRANEIKKYWVNVWGIDSSRIIVRARNLPEKPTTSRDSLGIEENRRVEFTSDSWDIMKPVLVNDTIGIPMTPLIRFKMNAKADNGIATSRLDVSQGSRLLKNFTLSGKPDSVLEWSPIMDWETASDQSAVPKTEDDMKFTFEVTDNKGEKVRPTGSIPVEQITIAKKRESGTKDKEVAIFRLILFDFNSPAVGPTNATIIKQFILPKLRAGTKIQVTGFTDKLGNPDVNMRLSGGRAKSVADYIKWGDTTYKGVGGTRPIYPNDTPEGRIYSRSVEVRCEIPLTGN
jgi:outer membrane protein OmpA-like peptidoglycan-associated protein